MFRLAALTTALIWGTLCNAQTPVLQESTFWQAEVDRGDMPPIAARLPVDPLIVDLPAKGRSYGVQGGTLRTLVSRSRDVRQMVVYGYGRLIGYDEDYNLVPDILSSYDVEDNRKFTFYLRPGHHWSNGSPFTSADFEYWWLHIANNDQLNPSGPPEFMSVDGEFPTVTFPDPYTVVYEWTRPNGRFLQLLAEARPPFIYRPQSYLKQFHEDFADPESLAEIIDEKRVNSWAALHNKLDNMYKFDNPDEPTLQPWMSASNNSKSRYLFVRNPYFHRIDALGVQLPYIDIVEMTVTGGGLIAAKANAGEADLQARGLDFRDVPILKKGELDGGNYKTYLWSNAVASQIAIYLNLNFADPVWRPILRDVRFRRALSLAIDRRMINRGLYFGQGTEGGMMVLPESPFYEEALRTAWANYDLEMANALLDEMGLTERSGDGIRLLPDGRPLRVVVETAGERQEVENALQIVTDTWRDIGVQLIMRPLDRDILRNRNYAGVTMAAVWYGWDNGIPTAITPPTYLAPTSQDFFAWPMWGQYYQTSGAAGEPPDLEAAERLMELSHEWERAVTDAERADAWKQMLEIHADQVFGIGIVSETPQPVVVSRRLRNVPEVGLWTWDPGAHFGVHHIDEFYFDPDPVTQ
ncbi:MAG: ABC transporter substrate-binding protein [Paracoccaceae bacterium]